MNSNLSPQVEETINNPGTVEPRPVFLAVEYPKWITDDMTDDYKLIFGETYARHTYVVVEIKPFFKWQYNFIPRDENGKLAPRRILDQIKADLSRVGFYKQADREDLDYSQRETVVKALMDLADDKLPCAKQEETRYSVGISKVAENLRNWLITQYKAWANAGYPDNSLIRYADADEVETCKTCGRLRLISDTTKPEDCIISMFMDFEDEEVN
jgi:hypothetical protein